MSKKTLIVGFTGGFLILLSMLIVGFVFDIEPSFRVRATSSLPSIPTAPKPTLPPTRQVARPTNTVRPTETAAPTTVVPGTILFEEDFEDDRADDFTHMVGNWNVLLDEAENRVLDGDNRFEPKQLLSFGVGLPGWTDYALDYDIKLRNPTADMRWIFRNSSQGYYVHRLSLYYSHMSLFVTYPGNDWVLLKSRTYSFSRGVWYHVRLEAQGETLRVFVNEELEIETADPHIQAGDIEFGVMAPTRVQLDNLRVTVLAPIAPGEP